MRRGAPDRPSRGVAAILAVLVLPLAIACGEGPQNPEHETIALSVRTHVLSSTITTLDAETPEDRVREILEETNEIWAQAGVRWELESIRRDSLPEEGETTLLEARETDGVLPEDFYRQQFLPLEDHLDDAWNVYLLHNLGFLGARGMYIPAIPAVVSSDRVPGGLNPELVLAHELGHSLGLGHEPCGTEGNLMALPFCDVGTTRLSDEQIRHVREQANRGVPSTALDSISHAVARAGGG